MQIQAADDPLSQAAALHQQKELETNNQPFDSSPIKFWDKVGINLGSGVDMQHSWSREQAGALDWQTQKNEVLNAYTVGSKIKVDEGLLGDASNQVLESGKATNHQSIEHFHT